MVWKCADIRFNVYYCLSSVVCARNRAAVKCKKLVQSDEKSSCQKDGPRLGPLSRGLQNSVGVETIFEMAEGRLPRCQL